MDPLADKLLVCSALISFIELELLPAWIVIIIAREFIISGSFDCLGQWSSDCCQLVGKNQNQCANCHECNVNSQFR